ncbi:transcription factor subunit Med10 of mediator complex-domain-containing protein [Xylogone sp. PMI_703]|nr:transcription factor subunit Med10 of mediator complex-domain-containing protein [Xylogone sp. PMI_703]
MQVLRSSPVKYIMILWSKDPSSLGDIQNPPVLVASPSRGATSQSYNNLSKRYWVRRSKASTIMAPAEKSEHDVVENQIKDIIQDLYQILVQISAYDLAGKPSKDVLENEFRNLEKDLQRVHSTAGNPSVHLPSIPPELIQYVDNGRNPDIYTREFVELARRGNQLMKGKMEAFGSFRDVLAREMSAALPELRSDISKVLDATGGSQDVLVKKESV